VAVIFFVPILAAVRADLPYLAAFHPVGAVLAFTLAIVLARDATRLIGSTETDDVVALIVVAVLFLSLSGSPGA
jgi:hypothetical protein